MATSEFHALSSKTIKNEPYPFSDLKGKVVLIVNVASKFVQLSSLFLHKVWIHPAVFRA
jgi:glutathione peroxidase-family protein